MILEKVLHRLRPDSSWKVNGDSIIENLQWLDETQSRPSDSEIEAEWAIVENEIQSERARKKRDRLLSDSDWRALSDVNMSQEWIDYRQALRDVPQQSGFPDNIEWPVEPTE